MTNETDAKKIVTASPSENWRKPPGHHRRAYYMYEDYPARPEI